MRHFAAMANAKVKVPVSRIAQLLAEHPTLAGSFNELHARKFLAALGDVIRKHDARTAVCILSAIVDQAGRETVCPSSS